MKKNIFLTIFLFYTFTVSASVCQTIEGCVKDSNDLGLSFLPRYLVERNTICKLFNTLDCHENLIREANEILICRQSPNRQQEMASLDSKLFKELQNDYGIAIIPPEVKDLFEGLTRSSEEMLENRFPWKLSAYNATFLNAHAGADAQVMASSGLWNPDSGLSQDEIAAILAHEVAHVINNHSLELGCLALEWTGAKLTMSEAMEAFREDFSTSTERGKVWSKKSNSIEFEADAVATRILHLAGHDPFAMGRALNKLRPKNGSGFSSGSHPEIDARIQAAISEAHKTISH
jgi:predicted Zn-dependent protease